MIMPISRRTSLLAALLLPAVAFAACGGDDDSSSKGTSATTAKGAAEATTTTAKAGSGTGTFTIGGTEFSFEAPKCSIGGDKDQPKIDAEGKGTADGKPFTVVVTRSPSKDSVLENFQLVFTATESIVGTNVVGLPQGKADSVVSVEGQKATGTFPNFLGTGGRPSGEGTFTLTCDK
jgi:hypothetical protein